MSAARIARLSAALDDECRRRGHPLRPGAAEELLRSRVEAISMQMGVKEKTALGYFTDDWPMTMADSLAQTVAENHAVQQGPPITMPMVVAGRLISALGVAAKFAVLNAEHADVSECVDVAARAGDALTVLGAAMRSGALDEDRQAGMLVVHVEQQAVHMGHNALRLFRQRLADGSWRDCWCGVEDLDHLDLDELVQAVGFDVDLIASVLRS